MKAAFHTLGCKVNQYETEAIIEQFKAAGFEIAEEDDFADVYVINTCTVTHLADRKSRQYIRKMKKKNPESVIAVTGCYAQVSKDEIEKLEEVDVICGTDRKQNLIDYVEEFIEKREETGQRPKTISHVLSYEDLEDYHSSGLITSMESRTRAYVKIQEGCNRFCSYCIIPYSRGKVRSRDTDEILQEIKGLIKAGFKEIILTGINTALYGTDLGQGGIEPLIGKIDALPGDFRIRLSSLEPTVINAEYVKSLLKYEKLCPHLHLSVQSGSDRILKKMNRRYDRKEYLDIVKVLKEKDPGYGITTDIITGFPGENEEDFEESLRIVEEAGFCKVHAFRYSKRKGTPAAAMEDQVDPAVKKERAQRLMEKGNQVTANFFERSVGEVRRVLFEENTEDGKFITGYTENYVKIYSEPEANRIGEFSKVRLTERFRDGMKGEILNE